MAEKDIEAGFRVIAGDVGDDVVVSVDAGCTSNWFSPGMSWDSLFTPRPLVVEVPPLEDPGTATAETGAVEVEVVGLETAPANEKEDGDVVVIEVVFVGAGAAVGAVAEVGAAVGAEVGAGAGAGTRAVVVELTDAESLL